MSEVYVVKNQDGYYASKQKEWLDGREPKLLFRSPHKDEAINMVFELSSKDIYVRAYAEQVEINDKKLPIVQVTVPLVEEVPEPEEPAETQIEVSADSTEQQETNNEPRELTASERLSMMAARLREQEEA